MYYLVEVEGAWVNAQNLEVKHLLLVYSNHPHARCKWITITNSPDNNLAHFLILVMSQLVGHKFVDAQNCDRERMMRAARAMTGAIEMSCEMTEAVELKGRLQTLDEGDRT
jgi:hypothetical protein